MLVVEDYLFALEWAEEIGGLDGTHRARHANAAALDGGSRPWLEHLAADPAIRSNTSVCLKFADRSRREEAQPTRQEARRPARSGRCRLDIGGYRDAPPGLRIWCGATVDTADIEALGPWLDWAWRAGLTHPAEADPMPKIRFADTS